MKISGEATLHAPVDRVYAALNDPAVLVRTIPGCERLERVGSDAYTMVVTAGVASVKGTYTGEVALTDQDPPYGFTLKASGAGGPGTVSATARVKLAGDGGDGGGGGGEDGTTTLTYDADAVVGGMVGGVGQRVLTGVAKKTAAEFFAAVDGVLTGPAAPAPAEKVAPAAVVEPAVGPGAEPAVYTRPPSPARGLPGGDFAAGVLFGAAAALVGALVGGFIARSNSARSNRRGRI
jgi:carbon monoxide dehydrogenase subunit G